FDFANIFCNPDLEIAAAPGRLRKQATVIAAAAKLDRRRLLKWILAYAGLSAAWSLGSQDGDAELDFRIADLAAAELEKCEGANRGQATDFRVRVLFIFGRRSPEIRSQSPVCAWPADFRCRLSKGITFDIFPFRSPVAGLRRPLVPACIHPEVTRPAGPESEKTLTKRSAREKCVLSFRTDLLRLCLRPPRFGARRIWAWI